MKGFKFVPQPDITAYELYQCLMHCSPNAATITRPPTGTERHWQPENIPTWQDYGIGLDTRVCEIGGDTQK